MQGRGVSQWPTRHATSSVSHAREMVTARTLRKTRARTIRTHTRSTLCTTFLSWHLTALPLAPCPAAPEIACACCACWAANRDGALTTARTHCMRTHPPCCERGPQASGWSFSCSCTWSVPCPSCRLRPWCCCSGAAQGVCCCRHPLFVVIGAAQVSLGGGQDQHIPVAPGHVRDDGCPGRIRG